MKCPREKRSLLMVAAVRQELAPFLRQANGSVNVLFTGMGPLRAKEAVGRYLARAFPSAIVVAGFSGGMRSGLRMGDRVVASEVVESDSGARYTACLSLLGNEIDGTIGRLVSSPRLLSASEKRKLGLRYDALAVDMETAAVAGVAERFQVPWAALRVILDPVEVDLKIASLGECIDLWKAVRLASRSLSDGLRQVFLSG